MKERKNLLAQVKSRFNSKFVLIYVLSTKTRKTKRWTLYSACLMFLLMCSFFICFFFFFCFLLLAFMRARNWYYLLYKFSCLWGLRDWTMNQNSKNKHNGQLEMYFFNSMLCEWLSPCMQRMSRINDFRSFLSHLLLFHFLYFMAIIIINVEC